MNHKNMSEPIWFTYINNEKVIVDAISHNEDSYDKNVFTCIGKHLVVSDTAKGLSYPVYCFVYNNKL
jgi:hypothetical protein